MLGDFNARVGTNHNVWAGVIGKHGLGNDNSSGIRLLNLCSEFGLIITNTLFQQRNQRKATWMHPRSKHWHLIDFAITRACDVSDVLLTRAMRGAECWTDHRLVVSKLRLSIRPPVRKQKPQKRLNIKACKDTAVQEDLQKRLSDALQSSTVDSASTVTDSQSLTDEWSSLSSCIMQSATNSLGFSAKSIKTGLMTKVLKFSVHCKRKMKAMMQRYVIQPPPSCITGGRNCVAKRSGSFATWRTAGGLRRQRRYSCFLIQMTRRCSMKH